MPQNEEVSHAPAAKIFTVSEGKHAKFRCCVTGKPQPEIVWKKDGQSIVPGRRHLLYQDREGYFTLKVLYCQQWDRGLYICSASNVAGQTLSAVELHVKEPRVKFQCQLEDAVVYESDDAILVCRVPEASVSTTWYMEDRKLQTSQKYVIREQGTLRRLIIRDACMDDDGIYLCEMKGGGRSIAEVTVKGPIVKRLPTKLDVLEGENTVLCVETEAATDEVRWSRNQQQIQESPRTVLKSFGKTHLLVLVNVTREDAGRITFSVKESQTSAQLRVKCIARAPPGAPVAVKIKENPNAALLSWCPPPNLQGTPPSTFILERQELGDKDWVKCFTTDCASVVEIQGESVPSEAKYRFRICSVNKYGKSRYVEFPGNIHLVPRAQVRRPLQNVFVREGEDAEFFVELSASVTGSWLVNGKQVNNGNEEEEEGRRYHTSQERTLQSMLIQGVLHKQDGAEITFLAEGIRESARLHVQAPQVSITQIPEEQRRKTVVSGQPLFLECEVSSPEAPVRWFRDGQEVVPSNDVSIRCEGRKRNLLISCPCPEDSGMYTCDALNDTMTFTVEVSEPPVRIVNTSDDFIQEYVTGEPVVLSCELSRAGALVHWYKDGVEVETNEDMRVESDGVHHRLIIPSVKMQDSGEFVCDVGHDSVFYTVKVTAPQVSITQIPEEQRRKTVVSGQPLFLECEVSSPEAPVRWFQDGQEVVPSNDVSIRCEGRKRNLLISCPCPEDSGTYICDALNDTMTFTVEVSEPPVRIVNTSDDFIQEYVTGEPVVLSCELSRAGALVHWYKDGMEVETNEDMRVESDGVHHRLIIPSAKMQDSGEFVCDVGDDSVFYTVKVTAPQVSITQIPEQQRRKTVVSGQPLFLECEVSSPEAPVCWFRDGQEVVPSNDVSIQCEGRKRNLLISCPCPKDSGTYTCDALNDTMTFTVEVSEPPVRIVNTSDDFIQEYVTGEPVVLSCELSRAGALVHWYKDGVEVETNEDMRVESDGVHHRLIIPSAKMQDSGEFVCDVGDDSVFYTVKVTDPAVRIVHPTDHSVKLKFQTFHHIELKCELSRPNAEVRWFKDGLEVDETENLRLETDGAVQRLHILSASMEDSGEYICDTSDDSVSFDVKVTDPAVRILHPSNHNVKLEFQGSDHIELKCELSRPNAEVRWFKDGLEVDVSENLRLDTDGAVQRLTILSASMEDSGEYVCDANDDFVSFDVRVTEPLVKILDRENLKTHLRCLPHEDLALQVKLSLASADLKWFKDGEKIVDSSHTHVEEQGALRSLLLLGAESGDSGEYLCVTHDDNCIFYVTVEEPPVQILNKEDIQNTIAVLQGEKVTLTVKVSEPTAPVQWLRNCQQLSSGSKVQISNEGSIRLLTIEQAEIMDSGTYTCTTTGDELHFSVQVNEGPVKFVNKQDTVEDILALEGSSAVLVSVVSKQFAAVTWYRHQQALAAGQKYEMRQEGCMNSLVVSSIEREDSGLYTCLCKGDQMQFDVRVKELPVVFTRGLYDLTAQRDKSVVFQCELCKMRGDVMWMKDGRLIQPSRRHVIKAEGRERSLTILHVDMADAGEYSCESKDDKTLATLTVETARAVEFISELHNVTVLEGDTATFKCVVSPEDVDVCWLLNGSPFSPDPKYIVNRNGMCHSLTIRQCQISDGATVTAVVDGVVTKARLNVQEAQAMFLKKLQNVIAEEMQDVTLEVEVSVEGAEVQWLKQGVVIQPSGKYTLETFGQRHMLTIHNVTFSDRGNYRCESLHDKTQARLCVDARKVMLRTPLVDMEVCEKETVTFQLELSHPGVEGVWTKDGIRVKPNSRVKVSANGCLHSLTLSALRLEDSGEIIFSADNIRSCARLRVREPPVTIIRKSQDVGVPETVGARFECELSRAAAEVKWYKDGKEMETGPNCRIYSMGRRRIVQLSHCRLEDAGTYTCDAGDCAVTSTLQVYERELKILKELEAVDVRESDNAVFMCEVSQQDVKGEWFKNGENLKSTNRIKIRQEGSKHFLLICDVMAEDAGEIVFIAKKAVSRAHLTVNDV
ncbi:obscurin-like protein 1 [Microcaecilia unicolor]|uniref:Obscurin-like protein 1 n=1 Tax=Microcaecilia unicolor TaxID=1415580 RepID=A0A6P7X2K3_9AMPH|nr:obscurin-like protein 1 [Microcaecilia unicolor]